MASYDDDLDNSINSFQDVLDLIKAHESGGTAVPKYIYGAKNGNRESLDNLGMIYEGELTLPLDHRSLVISYMFYKMSTMYKYQKAEKGLDKVKKYMSEENIIKAERFVQDWIKKYDLKFNPQDNQ